MRFWLAKSHITPPPPSTSRRFTPSLASVLVTWTAEAGDFLSNRTSDLAEKALILALGVRGPTNRILRMEESLKKGHFSEMPSSLELMITLMGCGFFQPGSRIRSGF